MLFALLTGTVEGSAADTNAALTLPEFQAASAREYLQTICQMLPAQLGTNADCFYVQARLMSNLGDKQEAERLARKGWETDTNRADIAVFLADMLIRKDRMEEAASCLRAAVKANPRVPRGQGLLGMVLDRLGRPEEAEAAFTKAVSLNPRDAQSRLLLGRFLFEHGALKEAVTNLEQACQLAPESANAYYPLFQAQTRLGNKEAAEAALSKFKELKKLDQRDVGMFTDDVKYNSEADWRAYVAGVHVEVATILISQGAGIAADAHLRQAMRIAPQDPQAYEMLSNRLLQAGRPQEARSALEDLARLRPNDVHTRINLGTVLLQLNDYPAGVAELKRALELDPRQPQALHNLARHYLSIHRELPEALDLCQRLVACEPSAASYDLLARAFYTTGRTNDALQALAKTVEIAPDDPVYRQRYERLKKAAGATH